MSGALLSPQETEAISTYFDGDQDLFLAFRDSCVAQFRNDIESAVQACAAADLEALRRIVHSLKSVMLTLGHADLSAMALQTEVAAKNGDWAAAQPAWQALLSVMADRFGLSA